jgi:peptide/nickel transport system permease protein
MENDVLPTQNLVGRFMEDDVPSVDVASQWKLMWWKFSQHRLAVVSLIVILAVYVVAFFAGFFAPVAAGTYDRGYVYAPPQALHIIDSDGAFGPFVYGYAQTVDPDSLRRIYTINTEEKIALGFFVKGETYRIGLHGIPVPIIRDLYVEWDVHFFGPKEPDAPFYWLGGDSLGHDVFSRVIWSSQVSLSIGLLGVFVSLTLGIILGGISGLVGGWVDEMIQRIIELLRSIPTVPLWLGFAAAIPSGTDPVHVYFLITLILSLIGWTGMARVVRGRFLSLREEEFIMAAELDGVPRLRIITHHMVPSFLSHIIASVTLAIPAMILGETALSFLNIGLRPPAVSWGVMLQQAQSVSVVANSPWLLAPGLAVVITVLALNFLGDGLRDAADPYR